MTTATDIGGTAARQTLIKLLRRAEAAAFRQPAGATAAGPPVAAVRATRISAKEVSEYFALPSHETRRQYHAYMQRSAASGAIRLRWDTAAGENGQLDGVVLADPTALASFLTVRPAWVVAAHASDALRPDAQRLPSLHLYVDSWLTGRRPRGTGPEDWADVQAACRVLDWVAQRPPSAPDMLVRRLSIELFKDSKWIERRLTKILDALTGGNESEDGDEDVLERLGLVKHPLPLHVAGDVLLFLGGAEHPCPRPYAAYPPDFLDGLTPQTQQPGVLLTVENLATFNELARDTRRPVNAIALYTGGMPSPAHVRAYGRIVRSLPDEWQVAHWGDVDLGGFRIARHLSQACRQAGKPLSLRLMTPRPAVDAARFGRRLLEAKEQEAIQRICRCEGWDELVPLFDKPQHAVEQEATPPNWAELLATPACACA